MKSVLGTTLSKWFCFAITNAWVGVITGSVAVTMCADSDGYRNFIPGGFLVFLILNLVYFKDRTLNVSVFLVLSSVGEVIAKGIGSDTIIVMLVFLVGAGVRCAWLLHKETFAKPPAKP